MLLSVLAGVASASSTVLVAGAPLRWEGVGGERPYVPVAVNVENAADLEPEEIRASVVRALAAWQEASGDAFDFDVWIGVDPAYFPTGQRADGYTTVSFASADPSSRLADSVAGHTALFYDETGWVLEGDIVVNDLPFLLTRDPMQTNYAEDGWATRTLYFDDIVTHEIGHLLGLGHTGVGTSTMFAGAWVGQSTLGCDDVNGIRELYRPGGGTTVSGRVAVEGVGPLAGIEVQAIGVRARTVRAAAFTDPDGDYALTGLPPDDYLLVAGPYGGNPAGLPVQLAENFVRPCTISRTLYGGGEAVTLAGDDRTASWSLDCGGGVALSDDPAGREVPVEVELVGGSRIAHAERVPTEGGTWLRVPADGGALSLDVLSWSLFSPARVDVEVYDADGLPLDAIVTQPLVDHPDAPVWDARVELDEVPPGGVLLYLTSSSLPGAAYPGGRSFLAGDPFAVIVGEVGEPPAPETCAPAEDGAGYEAPTGFPLRSAREARAATGLGCATGQGPVGFLALALAVMGLRRRR